MEGDRDERPHLLPLRTVKIQKSFCTRLTCSQNVPELFTDMRPFLVTVWRFSPPPPPEVSPVLRLPLPFPGDLHPLPRPCLGPSRWLVWSGHCPFVSVAMWSIAPLVRLLYLNGNVRKNCSAETAGADRCAFRGIVKSGDI